MENKSQEYRFDGKLIIGVDHGFGNMKTRNTVFRTGVKFLRTYRHSGRMFWSTAECIT